MNRPKLWTANFLTLAFVNFLVSVNFYLLMVVVSVYAMDTFASSPSKAGLASSIFVVGALISRLFSGKWIERVGRKKMLYTGLLLSLIMMLLYFGVNSIIFLFVIRFLHGAAFGITSNAAGAIVAHIIPKERYGEGIGFYMLNITLATAIGPFLGMFISQRWGFGIVFIGCTLFAVFSLLFSLFLSVPEVELTAEQLEEFKGFKFNNFFETKAIPISIFCAVIYFSYSSVFSFLTAYAKEIQLVDTASFFFIVYSVVILCSRPFTGRIFDLKGENLIMYPAILTFMVGMIILSQAHYGYVLLLAAAFIGLGLGAIQSSSQAISLKVTPPHRRGLANSTYWIFIDLGLGVGPFIFGIFIPYSGYRGIYLGVAVLAFACMLLYYLLHGKKAINEKQDWKCRNETI